MKELKMGIEFKKNETVIKNVTIFCDNSKPAIKTTREFKGNIRIENIEIFGLKKIRKSRFMFVNKIKSIIFNWRFL